MSLTMQVRQSETGLVRLFAIDLPVPQALALKERPEALPPLLGTDRLADDQWELFDLADLAGMGLESYLSEGHGIAETELAPLRWRLDALEGAVLLLRSAAIPEKPATLSPRAPLRWVATFGEEVAPVPLRPDLSSDSARGGLAPPPQATRGPNRSVMLAAMGGLILACTALALYLLLAGATAP